MERSECGASAERERMNGKYSNLDNILHRTESSDRVAAVLGLKNHPIMSMLSGHGDQEQKKKSY